MLEKEKSHVLIVEDNEFNASFVKVSLQALGVVADIAMDGIEALEFVKANKYDLILMDCQMPNMDGFEATKIIRSMGNDYELVPIIALTATDLKEHKLDCLSCGMNDVLKKPLEIEDVKIVLEKYVFSKNPSYFVNNQSENNELEFLFIAAENLSKVMRFSYKDAIVLLNDFYRMASKILDKIEVASLADNKDEVKKYAHQLKGMACNMRLREIQYISSDIEKKGFVSQNEITNLYDMVEKLKQK